MAALDTSTTTSVVQQVQPVPVLYCAKCGIPPEYCEYGPDFERACNPWLKKHHPDVHAKLQALRGSSISSTDDTAVDGTKTKAATEHDRPTAPWTIQERLTMFYQVYVPEKVSDVPGLLEKYAGKEDKLFLALVKKYGPEPEDPYYLSDSNSEDEDDSEDGDEEALAKSIDTLDVNDGKKRRGVKAKKAIKFETKVIIQTQKVKKKKAMTIIAGMETVEGVKLKDVSKAFSKRFAGSSSVKDGPSGKEIIIQGDHKEDVAAMIVNEFKVPGSSVFLDFDGDIIAYS